MKVKGKKGGYSVTSDPRTLPDIVGRNQSQPINGHFGDQPHYGCAFFAQLFRRSVKFSVSRKMPHPKDHQDYCR